MGKSFLDAIEFGSFGLSKLFYLVHEQVGEQLEEAYDIGIIGVTPELPVIVPRQTVIVQPQGSGGRLPHFDALACPRGVIRLEC